MYRFSRIQDSLMHYLTGPEITETHPSPSRIHVGSNHSGMGKPIVLIESCAFLSPVRDSGEGVNCQNSCCARGERARTECVAGEGREWARGREGGLSNK